MDPVLRALNRFGMGARAGERGRLTDPHAWLRAQLTAPRPEPGPERGTRPRVDRSAQGRVPTAEEIADTVRRNAMSGRLTEQERQAARRKLQEIVLAETGAALGQRISTDRPFVERLVAFWSNHLCVSGARPLVAPLAGSYERDVIRAHVLGRFEDMVLASARHPAMLIYLDNWQSIGPSSRRGRMVQRAGVQRGLNENHARELLELHTLGVNGGYSQDDVLELARLLTGWTVGGLDPRGAQRQDGALRFVFDPALHEPGTRTVLGERYGGGAREGERAIRALCRHPATAQFVATKLVRHFIADDPPAAAVSHVARAFSESGGDLRVTAESLIDAPEAWSSTSRKFRTPQDWLVAVMRAFGTPAAADALPPLLRQLRQPIWGPPSPQGYGDGVRECADPDSLLNRAELARTLARRVVRRGMDPRTLLDVVDTAGDDPLHTMLADTSIAAGERVALAIAGPAFQWR
jgi:uncharacterized protein (DUF1800 family)